MGKKKRLVTNSKPCRRVTGKGRTPIEAHGPHDNCPGLAAHPNVMIGRS